jgi:hypothetical protein
MPFSSLTLVRALVVGAFVVVVTLPSFAAQDHQPKTADPIVELPKFVVTDARDLPPPESWRYAEIPGFEILTNASAAGTQRLLHDFGLFRQALGLVFPMPDRASGPTTLILCGRGGQFDRFLPAGKAVTKGEIASVFLHAHGRSAIVIDLEAAVLDLPSTGDESAPTQIAVDHDKQLDREYVHFLLGRNEPRPPAWLEEGIAQIIMAMKFEPKSITFGQLEDPNRVSTGQGLVALVNGPAQVSGLVPKDYSAEPADVDPLPAAPAEDRDFNAALYGKPLMSLAKFFAVGHDAPEALNPLGNNLWAKQAYAFVHLCLYGEGGRYQKPLGQFLARISKEPVSEALFKDCFKASYPQMLVALRSYIEMPVYKLQQFNSKGDGLTATAPVLREATPSEVGRLKGETLGLAGHQDQARAELIAPYLRGERDPRLLAALGLSEHASGEETRARKFLEAATDAKVVRPEAYLELARLRYADALAQPAAADGSFSPAQTTGVLAPLLAARHQPPVSAGFYELIADTWERSASRPTHEDVAVLIEGVRLFPTRLRLIYQSAFVCARAGLTEPAIVLSDFGLQVAREAPAKARFQALKASLSSTSRPPATPSAR